MKIAIINGPNLNLQGHRQPEIYGTRTFADLLADLQYDFPGMDFELYQSNHEGDIIDALQRFSADPSCRGIIINPGALAHCSLAVADAIRDTAHDCVEVHISNIHAREEYRSRSVTAAACRAVIAGAGLDGYRLAARLLLS